MSTSTSDGDSDDGTLRWPAMSALVVGGMVGGGIYVALGVVVETAGRWAWLSFLIAGIVAVATAHSYAALSNHFRTGGGAFAFLEAMDRRGAAGSLSWVLIGAYTLTIALYASAFGEYVSHAIGTGRAVSVGLAIAIVATLTGLNLLGLGSLTRVEITIVTANLLVLLALGVAGVVGWAPEQLTAPDGPRSVWSAGMGAAAIFVSYEGFQLLTYEYGEVDRPERTLHPVLVWSAAAVVAIYMLVAVGATMLAGADEVVRQRTVALSVAAQARFGVLGLVAMTVAAALATSAAINSTLFSTAQLAQRVADDGELPATFDHRNAHRVPDRAVVAIAAAAALLTVVGSLGSLVEAASLAFLAAFGSVHVIALREDVGSHAVAWLALVVGGVVAVLLVFRLATERPVALALMIGLLGVSLVVRPWLLRRTTGAPDGQDRAGA